MVESFNVVLKMFGTSLEKVVEQVSDDYDKLSERMEQLQLRIDKGPFKDTLVVKLEGLGLLLDNCNGHHRVANRIKSHPDEFKALLLEVNKSNPVRSLCPF